MSKFDLIFEEAMRDVKKDEISDSLIAKAKNTPCWPRVLDLVKTLMDPPYGFIAYNENKGSSERYSTAEKITADLCLSDKKTIVIGTDEKGYLAGVKISLTDENFDLESPEAGNILVVKVEPVNTQDFKDIKSKVFGQNDNPENVPHEVAEYIKQVQIAADSAGLNVAQMPSPEQPQPGGGESALPGVGAAPAAPEAGAPIPTPPAPGTPPTA